MSGIVTTVANALGYGDDEGIKLQLNINNYLNNEYSDYCDRVQGRALSQPAAYFEYREKVSKQLKTSATSQLYKTIYFALRDGKRFDGKTDLVQDMIAGSPSMSDQNINEIAIALAKTLNSELDKVLDLICPVTSDGVARSRLKAQGNASNIP